MSQEQLVVTVKGDNGAAFEGVDVSIDNTQIAGKTDRDGNVALDLPKDLNRLNITARYGKDSVQTPFYVTVGGPRKLTIDFHYLQKQIQEISQAQATPAVNGTGFGANQLGFIILAVIGILLVATAVVLIRKKRKHKVPQVTMSHS